MATTMTLIAKQTVGANGASSVTFSSIPDAYTDLKIVVSARNTSSAEIFDFGFNGVTTNQTSVYLNGAGSSSSVTSGTYTLFGRSVQTGATASTFSNNEIYIPNYRSTNAKSVSIDGVNENNATGAYSSLVAGLWNPGTQAPITSITFTATNFAEGSTFYLYGISNSTTTQATTVPYASGGDIISTDGTYWYHTFLYSGTFTPLKNLTCDYLVVAGGGGGGYSQGGGGGAGGLRSTVTATGGGGTLESALSLTANTSYVAQVGSGGAGSTSSQSYGANGGNSIFATITSTGGGGGGTGGVTGQNGGSGGGTGGNGPAGTFGTGTSNQGYAGGTANTSGPFYGGGGGGGAGAVGGNGTSSTGGNGGNGVAVAISGSSITYAGGGGAGTFTGGTQGTGGTGGGGNAGSYTSGQAGFAGTANRGGGGGGSSYGPSFPGSAGPGGNGGSGIIIVRYAV